MHQHIHPAAPTARRLIAALTVALSVGALPASAAEDGAPGAGATFTIRGSGAIPCVQWSQDHHGANETLREVDNSWLLGYITGFNKWGASGRGDILNGDSDPGSAVAWIGDYCTHYPLDKLETAAAALIMGIEKTSGPPVAGQPTGPLPRLQTESNPNGTPLSARRCG